MLGHLRQGLQIRLWFEIWICIWLHDPEPIGTTLNGGQGAMLGSLQTHKEVRYIVRDGNPNFFCSNEYLKYEFAAHKLRLLLWKKMRCWSIICMWELMCPYFVSKLYRSSIRRTSVLLVVIIIIMSQYLKAHNQRQ